MKRKSYLGEPFNCADGVQRIYGEWYNFGGNVSLRAVSPNGFRLRCDDTGAVSIPAGPGGRDALAMAMYRGECPSGYAHFCFGDEFREAA